MSTYECTNHFKLVFAGHAKESSPQPEKRRLVRF